MSHPEPHRRRPFSPDLARKCEGWPLGHDCPALTSGGQWCQGCLRSRDYARGRGVPADVIPVGIIIADMDAPRLACKCGGDPLGPRHTESLLHLQYSWRVKVGLA